MLGGLFSLDRDGAGHGVGMLAMLGIGELRFLILFSILYLYEEFNVAR